MSVITGLITSSSNPSSTVFEGAWVTATLYLKNQQVANDADLYLCIVDHTSAALTEPGTGADWTDKWVRQVDALDADKLAACEGTDTPSALNKFATKTYVDQLSFCVDGVAGEALDAYDVVYAYTDGKYYLADANGSIVESDAVGIVTEVAGIAQNATGTIHVRPGFVTNAAWSWTPHQSLFLGENGGLVTSASGLDNTKPMGYAETATQIYFCPQTGWSNNPWFEITSDQLSVAYIPDEYTRIITPECTTEDQLAAHLKGINEELATIRALIPS